MVVKPVSPTALNGLLWLAWGVFWFVASPFVKNDKVSERMSRRLHYMIPMVVGFFLVFQRLTPGSIHGQLYYSHGIDISGNLLTLGGLVLSVWARIRLGRNWSGHINLKEGHKLIRTGPYRFVRHPIYTGMSAAAAGSAMTAATGGAYVGLALIFIAILIKIRREERIMLSEFGEEYQRFKQEAASLLPFVF